MKKYIILFVLICMSFMGYSQTIDTVFTTPVYKSYFNKTLKEPIIVSYKLYHAGGNDSRVGLFFKPVKGITTTAEDYSHSGYDEGHLAEL